MGKLRVLALLAAALVVVASACGGKVAVDSPGSEVAGGGGVGGVGGLGGSGAVGSTVGAGGEASCFNPPDPSQLTFCSSTSSNGSCENAFCDDSGNIWTATCTATSCQCRFNTKLLCTCALNGSGDFCNGTPTCCPGLVQN